MQLLAFTTNTINLPQRFRIGNLRTPTMGRGDSSTFEQAVKEHQALFLFLHGVFVGTWLRLSYQNIANVITYAELYDLLPHVAASIDEHLLSRNDIWSDIRDNAIFHLGIAKKIRSASLFLDALRHFIGSGSNWEILSDKLGYSNEKAALMVLPKREELQKRTSELVKQLQRLTLTPYVPRSDTEHPDPQVRSTFLASGHHYKTLREQAYFIARSVSNEWMTHQLAGLPHWSHMRYTDQYSDGHFTSPGLRFLCNAIVNASRVEDELSLFDKDVASKYAAIFFPEDSRREVQAHISDTLTLLVRTATAYILPLITPPPSRAICDSTQFFRHPKRGVSRKFRGGMGRVGFTMSGHRRRGGAGYTPTDRSLGPVRPANFFHITKGGLMGGELSHTDDLQCAQDDNKCPYFTCIPLSAEDLPGYDEEPWKAHSIDGLEDASTEWLDLAFSAYGEQHAPREPVAQDGGQHTADGLEW